MICIIVDNFAHRLMNDGSIESAKIRVASDTERGDPAGIAVRILAQWNLLDPIADLQMNPGEFDAFIRKNLQALNLIFPADRPKLPVSEKKEFVTPVVAPV